MKKKFSHTIEEITFSLLTFPVERLYLDSGTLTVTFCQLKREHPE